MSEAELLAMICGQLGASPADTEQIVASGCLQLDEVDLVVRLDEDTQQLEILADCGVPAPSQEHGVFRHLLHDALTNTLPAIAFGVHPRSGCIVGKATVFAPLITPEDPLCAPLMQLLATRARELREQFALRPAREGFA